MTSRRRRFLQLCGISGIGMLAGCSNSLQTDDTPTRAQNPVQSQTAAPSANNTSVRPTQQANFAPDNGESSDNFGFATALSDDGTTALVSGYQGNDMSVGSAGTAYIFEYASGSWTQQAELIPNEDDGNEFFGFDVALSSDGNTAFVSTVYLPRNAEQTGSVYVFDNSEGSWEQQARLTPSLGDDYALFGYSVAQAGNGSTVLIGTFTFEEFVPPYVFTRSDGTWTQQARLSTTDTEGHDNFSSVALSSDGTTALIGAHGDANPNETLAGSAFVFEYEDGSWDQQHKITASDGDRRDGFGFCVALSGDGSTALIGTIGYDYSNENTAGSAYIFQKAGSSWNQRTKLIPNDGDDNDSIGSSLAISSAGTTAVVGAYSDDSQNGEKAGSTYLFDSTGDTWTQEAKLVADDGDSKDQFGYSVAVSSDGGTTLVGAPDDADHNGPESGTAYVYIL